MFIIELHLAVEALRPYVLSRLAGLGDVLVDDVLSDAQLSALEGIGAVRDTDDVARLAAHVVRIQTLRARASAVKERSVVTSLDRLGKEPVARSVEAGGVGFDADVLAWLVEVAPAREAQLLEALREHEGDSDAARMTLAWQPRKLQHARQLLGALALTISNALSTAEDDEPLTALGCLPTYGPWREVVIVSGQHQAHERLGISRSQWNRGRHEAEQLMKAARRVLGRSAHSVPRRTSYAYAI